MDKGNNPEHIAIILDGNRRYARKQGLEAWKGHSFGAKKVEDLLEWCRDLGIKELTLYSFSVDNFKRPEKEKMAIFELFKKNFENLEKDERLMKNGIKVNFIGRIGMFPKDIQEKMHSLMEKTRKNGKFKVNFAMAYSGKAEITDSIKRIIQKINDKDINDINEDLIKNNLYLSSEPDIFIRPGGEKRMSDFLLWQSAYAEIFFISKLWPEFTKEDLIKIIGEFKQRERRFGK
ncbi:di-trans,poly-cis-decaprenylcistransferase [Candidatus Woesearchaeota archaeon]|nr:di-trans,poly-cis-decaprenylcistransferase [Candidatus Woesearchaeota archaeon]